MASTAPHRNARVVACMSVSYLGRLHQSHSRIRAAPTPAAPAPIAAVLAPAAPETPMPNAADVDEPPAGPVGCPAGTGSSGAEPPTPAPARSDRPGTVPLLDPDHLGREADDQQGNEHPGADHEALAEIGHLDLR